VHDLTPAPTRVVDLSGEVEGIVRASLAKTRRLALPGDSAGATAGGAPGSPAPDGYSLGFGILYQLVVDEERPATEPEKGTLYVLVEADMGRRRPGALPEAYEARAVRQLPYDPATDGALEPLLRGQIERTVDETRGRLVATLRLAGGSDAAVLAMLGDEDPLVRAAAAREAGERGLVGAVEPLERALDAEEAELRLSALGALGRIGDARAVPAVARRTQGMNVEEIRAAVFALGDIGGPEARRYLGTMAYGHPDPAIQDAAKAALAGAAGR
jgi:HEAT repeat protein